MVTWKILVDKIRKRSSSAVALLSLSVYKPVLADSEESPGPCHPQTLQVLGRYGGLLYSMGNNAEVAETLREAIRGQTETLGATHTITLATKEDLSKDPPR